MRLIDAERLIGCINTVQEMALAMGGKLEAIEPVNEGFISLVNSQPTIDAEPVKHAYLRKSRVFGRLDECSNCGCTYPHNRGEGVYLNYCAKCGAKIDGEVWD